MEIDSTPAMRRLERAIIKAQATWDKLHDAEVLFLAALAKCTPEERKAVLNEQTARQFFSGLGA